MMSTFIVAIARCLLVLLFLPFSALDKLLNFNQAVAQASYRCTAPSLSRVLIGVACVVEVVTSAAILTGIAAGLAARLFASYFQRPSILLRRFWKAPGLRLRGNT